MGKSKSVANKIIIITSIVILILNIVGAYILSSISSDKVTEIFIRESESLLKTVALSLNDGQFKEVIETGDMNSTAYTELRQYLKTVREELGVKFLYTLAYTPDRVSYYVVDSEVESSENFCKFGYTEDEVNNEYDALLQGQSITSEIIHSEQWGSLMSVEVGIFDKQGNMIGTVVADLEANEIIAEKSAYAIRTLGIMLLVAVVQLIFTYIGLQRLVAKPFKALNNIVDKTSQFDFTDMSLGSELSVREDEIGQITANLMQMRQNLRNKAEVVNNIASEMFEATDDMHGKLGASTAATEQINLSITELAEGVNNQVMRTTESYDMLQLLSEKIESLAGQIGHMNELTVATQNASEESSYSLGELDKTIQGSQRVSEQVQNNMQVLREHSQKIESVVEVIEGITRQTNLLALNAAIEAARAGEAGRGFGVVSDEIKGLSEDTFKSTEIIKDIVANVVRDVHKVLEDTEELMRSNEQMSQTSVTVEAAFKQTENTMGQMLGVIKELTTYTDEIRNYKDTVNSATEVLTVQAQQYSAITEEIASTTEDETEITRAILTISEDLKQRAQHLSDTVVEYKL